MKRNSTKKSTKRAWIQPLLGSLSLIDITLGSLLAGAALAEGPDASHLARLGILMLSLGCLSLWCLGSLQSDSSALTDHSRGRS